MLARFEGRVPSMSTFKHKRCPRLFTGRLRIRSQTQRHLKRIGQVITTSQRNSGMNERHCAVLEEEVRKPQSSGFSFRENAIRATLVARKRSNYVHY